MDGGRVGAHTHFSIFELIGEDNALEGGAALKCTNS